jgi:hypothetical protein
MLVKTSELTGAALDWAVAKCEGKNGVLHGITHCIVIASASGVYKGTWRPSTDWSQAGPIIERIKGFLLKHWLESNREGQCQAEIHNYDGDWIAFGPTPLVAAMRCYVAIKFGDTVEIPDQLL